MYAIHRVNLIISYAVTTISYNFPHLIFDFSNKVFNFVVSSRWYSCFGGSEGWGTDILERRISCALFLAHWNLGNSNSQS